MLSWRAQWYVVGVFAALSFGASRAPAQLFVPDKLFIVPYTFEDADPNSTLNITGGANPIPPGGFFPLTPIPDPFVIDETNINAPPTGFNRNEHIARFAKVGETGSAASAHPFQRSEAWDISFDLKIETPHATPRKEAGLYFESSNGNAIFMAASNAGHFTEGPGDIATVFERVIPTFSFGGQGALGDYNHNTIVDAADYTIWRDTLGSTEDFRANGNNEGASEDLIDEADYEVWKTNFGQGGQDAVSYTVGDTLSMRVIYTPPEIDPSIPFDIANPSANVIKSGQMEYLVSINGGATSTSGPLDFTYADDAPASIRWMGIPNGTRISLRTQTLSTSTEAPDSSKVTFSNFDFNGPGPGIGAVAGVPEPTAWILALTAMIAVSWLRTRKQ